MSDKPELSGLIREVLPPARAPEALHAWARERAREADAGREAGMHAEPPVPIGIARRAAQPWRRALYAAGLVAAVVIGYAGHSLVSRRATTQLAQDALIAQLVDAHVQSLMPGHLMDVQSTDQHTVKPWFIGRADFAPRVVKLDSVGFPLLGGRLAYVDGHQAAVLVYGRRKHVINLFMWRGTGGSDDARLGEPAQRAGYSVAHWTGDGLSFWAVTDASPADLSAFRAAYMRE